MATVIKNNTELQKVLKKKLYDWLVKIKEELPDILENYIETEYYDQYKPSQYYERQRRIITAIMTSNIKDIGNGYEFELYLDPTSVSYDPSIWTYDWGNSYQYRKGDSSEYVFDMISQGIHGDAEFGQTPGRFWDTFLEEINSGGTHDLFVGFKKYLGDKYGLKIR